MRKAHRCDAYWTYVSTCGTRRIRFRNSLQVGAGVGREVFLAYMFPIHMCVNLRRGYVGMAEDLLENAQVSATGKHMACKGVAKHVGMQARDAHGGSATLHHSEDALSADAPTASVEEDRAGVLRCRRRRQA